MAAQTTVGTDQPEAREAFSGRSVFILAAIGSAVGLGNIWRYPYVAFQSGGGAFLVPYVTALLTAGIPLLFLDYALGHRFRGSPPLAFKRLARWMEPFGWLQVLMCFVISTYYAVVLAWALRYLFLSFNLGWGKDPGAFFATTFLQQDSEMGGSIVWGIALPLLLIWVANIAILLVGIDKGIGRFNKIVLPSLIVIFILVVLRGLTLPGAAQGLNAFFTPDWSALKSPDVWIAAYGQIFFSLSVAFGAMLTYASYLKRRTNLTASGLVVAFSNSAFEVLAGIGVFACLGFLAQQQGVAVADAAAGGPGLAFVAFPALISEMPLGPLFGVLFFGCLVFAGLTSLISITQVVASAFQEKLGLGRATAIALVGGASALVSLALFPTTSGLSVLDVTDHWVNNIVLVGGAMLMLLGVVWGTRRVPELARHLNAISSFRVGRVWFTCLGILTPIVLAVMASQVVYDRLKNGYPKDSEGNLYGSELVTTFGWSQVWLLPLLAVLLSLIPFRREGSLAAGHDLDGDGIPDDREVMKGGQL